MNHCSKQDLGNRQAGGITIIVALMLLVLLTVAAMAMSRNSLRDITTTGFSRQGAMARNVADSGIEWTIHWIDVDNSTAASGLAPTGSSARLTRLIATLLDDTKMLAGVAFDLNSPDLNAPIRYVPGGALADDLKLPGTTPIQEYTLGLTRMGKLPALDTRQSAGQDRASGATQKNDPDLWAVRSDAQVQQGAVTFIHAKEGWISTAVRTIAF